MLRFVRILVFLFALDFMSTHVQSEQSNERCPEGYYLHTDELCYPKVRNPCPFEAQSTTTAPATATTQPPIRPTKLYCPEGSTMIKNICRKIICSFGEYYRGSCLQPVCPQGLVWHGKKCQKPGYLTTIIKIDNVIVNEVNKKPIALTTSDVNEIIYHPSTIHQPPTNGRQPKYSTTSTTAKYNSTNIQNSTFCCKVLTPRTCKLYVNKWLCFNRKYQLCDDRICKSPTVYLKPPAIKYEFPLLIMPPNPELKACATNNCNSDSTVDCSGCASFRPEKCSPYCYRYICPNSTCAFMDLNEYCNIYPGQAGCSPNDGCLWEFCQ